MDLLDEMKVQGEDLIFFFSPSFIYSYVHILFGPFLRPTPFIFPTLLPGRTCSALFSNFVEE
jgi:hypothetical protein